MSVVDHFPGITWTDTGGLTLGELRVILNLVDRMNRARG